MNKWVRPLEMLPWLSLSISPDEQQDMHMCLHRIIPDERLLQQIIFNWMDGVKICNKRKRCCEDDSRHTCSSLSLSENGHVRVYHLKTPQMYLPLIGGCNLLPKSAFFTELQTEFVLYQARI